MRVHITFVVSLLAIIIAMICAKPLLGNFEQAFQYIQEFTGFFTPGIVALFTLGFFWKRTTVEAALTAAIGSAVFSIAFKLLWPALPFIDRVSIVFILCIILPILLVLVQGQGVQKQAIDLSDIQLKTTNAFNFGSVGVALILIALYVTWW